MTTDEEIEAAVKARDSVTVRGRNVTSCDGGIEVAMATYRAACERWPGANITASWCDGDRGHSASAHGVCLTAPFWPSDRPLPSAGHS
jgi:hypothetical protein